MNINMSFTMNYLHLQGNTDVTSWLKHLIKCGLIASCVTYSLLGLLPNANACSCDSKQAKISSPFLLLTS